MNKSGFIASVVCFLLLASCTQPDRPGTDADAVLLGRLFDSRSGSVVEEAAVVLADGRVLCSGPAVSCTWSVTTPVVDYGDAMILPGLIDLHVHAREHYLPAFVPSGVTTIRDANNALPVLDGLRRAAGAPRIFAAGPMLDGPATALPVEPSENMLRNRPLAEVMPVVVETRHDAIEAVSALEEAGVEWIKLYEQLPPDAFQAAVAAAREAGIPVMVDLGLTLTRGLTGAEVDILQAADAGVSTNEHLSGLALAYQRLGGDLEADTLDHALLDTIVTRIAASGMAVVPTAGNSQQFETPGSLPLDDMPGAAMVAPHFGEFWTYLETVAASAPEQARTDRRLLLATLPKLKAAGVPIGAGSDLPAAPYMLPGGALHQELSALSQAGLSPVEALQAATWNAALILQANDLGHLEAGAHADLVIVDGDPTRDILDTRKVAAVWFGGREVDLDAAWQDAADALDARTQ